jgi:serine/threonine protein kinase
MGVLYLAEDQVLGRKAAIKLLQPDLLHNELAKERFLREARLWLH